MLNINSPQMSAKSQQPPAIDPRTPAVTRQVPNRASWIFLEEKATGKSYPFRKHLVFCFMCIRQHSSCWFLCTQNPKPMDQKECSYENNACLCSLVLFAFDDVSGAGRQMRQPRRQWYLLVCEGCPQKSPEDIPSLSQALNPPPSTRPRQLNAILTNILTTMFTTMFTTILTTNLTTALNTIPTTIFTTILTITLATILATMFTTIFTTILMTMRSQILGSEASRAPRKLGNWGQGRKRAQLAGTIISIGTKGAGRKMLSKMASHRNVHDASMSVTCCWDDIVYCLPPACVHTSLPPTPIPKANKTEEELGEHTRLSLSAKHCILVHHASEPCIWIGCLPLTLDPLTP